MCDGKFGTRFYTRNNTIIPLYGRSTIPIETTEPRKSILLFFLISSFTLGQRHSPVRFDNKPHSLGLLWLDGKWLSYRFVLYWYRDGQREKVYRRTYRLYLVGILFIARYTALRRKKLFYLFLSLSLYLIFILLLFILQMNFNLIEFRKELIPCVRLRCCGGSWGRAKFAFVVEQPLYRWDWLWVCV